MKLKGGQKVLIPYYSKTLLTGTVINQYSQASGEAYHLQIDGEPNPSTWYRHALVPIPPNATSDQIKALKSILC